MQQDQDNQLLQTPKGNSEIATVGSLIHKLMDSKSEIGRKIAAEMKRQREMSPEEREALKATLEARDKEFEQAGGINHNKRVSGIEGEDWNRTISAYTPKSDSQKKAYMAIGRAMRDWPKKQPSFYLYGDFGSGKSHLAKAYAIGVLNKGATVKLWRMEDFKNALFASWKQDGESLYRHPSALSLEVDLLIFDDIDKGGVDPDNTKQVYNALWSIVDKRTDQKKPIVVTSQFEPEKLGNLIMGGSIGDRFNMCKQIEVNGESGRSAEPEIDRVYRGD